MKSLRLIRGAAVALATLGMVAPGAPAMAAGPKPAARPSVRLVDAKVFDIALSKDGSFAGRVVDQTGTALQGAQVSVKQGNKEVARSLTDKDGMFAVRNLKGGLYAVSSGATEGTYRMWAKDSAPPAAKEMGLLVMGQNGTRGQYGSCDPCCFDPCGGGDILLAVAVGALVVGTIAAIYAIKASNNTDDIPQSP